MRPRNLRTFFAIFTVVAFLMGFAAPARAADDGYSYARIVRLSLVSGDVQLVRSEDAKWEPALMNMPIQQGMVIGTNTGRAEIEFENGGAIWLGADSILQFTELALSNGGRITKVMLSQGTATFDPNLASADSMLVSTPELQITPPGKSMFRVNVSKSASSLTVLNGRVSVTSMAGPKDLRKGETLALDAAAPTDAKVTSSATPDDWDKWVKTRANVLTDGQSQALQYTNTPFSYGMSELSTYGGWNFYPGFGYGWQPFGVLNGWAPFSAGQWSFYPGLGWTWLSFEPWGWVPYHFGAWEYSPVFGWLWLPGGYGFWSPAPVQWFGRGGRVGWSPVNPALLGSGHPVAPIVIATKDLGKGGPNKIVTSTEAGEKFEPLAAAPLSNGRIATPAELAALKSNSGDAARVSHHKSTQAGEARLVVPTAGNLVALKSGVGFDAKQNRFVNAASAPGVISAQPIALNGAPPAPKMPRHLPPVNSASATSVGPGGGRAGGGASPHISSGGTSRGTGTSSGGSMPHVGARSR